MPTRAVLFVATALTILGLAVLPLLTPWFVHRALDAAGSTGRLGLSAAQVADLSDRSVSELVLGPGDFAFAGPGGQPFYSTAERGHLGDARLLLGLCLSAAGLSLLVLGTILVRNRERRVAAWHTIGRAGLSVAVATVIVGLIGLLAFDQLFELFHEVFFPGGNWAFDAATSHLVQLYPYAFWQIASAALGTLMVVLGLATGSLARWQARVAGVGTTHSNPALPGAGG